MRSASDLTAVARIRATAMHLFALHGARGVSLRDVAREAGVSPSLVVHHFGSKEGLHDAVDTHVAEVMRQLIGELADQPDDAGRATAALWSAIDREPDLMAYLRRSLVEGGAPGRRLFMWMVEATERELSAMQDAGALRPSDDPRGRAVFLLANDMAPIVLRDLVADALGTDPLSRDGLARWSSTLMDVYTRGLFSRPADEED
ncbi:MAG TPA: TetR family transcriptional regulator [Angustibacter sp.]|nr:TetR family transcriptional regulator [Angustibacter sp.]